MKKRLGALILAMLMILSICPVVMAADAVSTASAYDVHIKGNFVGGETLTAHYTYYNSEDCDEDTTKTVYKWYYKKSGSTPVLIATKTGDNTLVIPNDIVDKGKWGALKDILVSVSTADANGNGAPVFSGIYAMPIPNSEDATENSNLHNTNWALNAHIVPKSYEGDTKVGDTLVARYSYQRRDGVAEGNTTFTWYRKDTFDGVATVIQEASTNPEYVITKADIGKWIECTVTPYNVNGAKGTASTAKIHYGNLGYLRDTNAELTFMNKLMIDGVEYPTNRLLSDGNTVMNAAVSRGSYIDGGSWANPGVIKYDFGKSMPIDGVFFHMVSFGSDNYITYAITEFAIEYSEDGNVWSTITAQKAESIEAKNHSWKSGIHTEYVLPKTVNARYVRFATDKCHLIRIEDFYPFQKQDANVSVPESVGVISNGVIRVNEFNKSSAALLSEITATSLIDDSALAPVYVDAEGNQITEAFNITDDTTAKLQVTGKNGVKLEYGLTFNKIEENIEIAFTSDIAALEGNKIKVDACLTPSEALLDAISATSAVNGGAILPTIVDSEGNEVDAFLIDENTTGKYVRFTNAYNDNYDYEIACSLIGSAHATEVAAGNANGAKTDSSTNITMSWADTDAKWHISAKVYAVPNQETLVGFNTGASWKTSMHLSPLVTFGTDGSITIAGEKTAKAFKWNSGMWHDVDFVFDSARIDPTIQNCPIDLDIYVDGVKMPMKNNVNRLNSQLLFSGGIKLNYIVSSTGDGTQTEYQIPKVKDVKIRKIYDNKTYVPAYNAALNLKSGNAIVTDIEPGVAYTFENTTGVYPSAGYTNYVAIYNADKTLDSVALEPATVTIKEGQVVKAFCLAPATLKPLIANGEWE